MGSAVAVQPYPGPLPLQASRRPESPQPLSGSRKTLTYHSRFDGAWGYITDPSGFEQLGYRFYWPELGRFIQQDPIGDGMNWYAYVGNNPVNWVDPYGLFTIGGFEFNADEVWCQLQMSAGATVTGLVDGASLGLIPLAKEFGLLSPGFADWTDPNDPYARWSRNWGTVSGAAITGAAGAAALRVEVNVFSRGNVFKIISKTLRRGFRMDIGKHRPWGHTHWWHW